MSLKSAFLLSNCSSDLDRTNLGNARLQGLPQDTLGGDPSGKLFDWVNSVFFLSYVSLIFLDKDTLTKKSRRSYFRYRLRCVRNCSPLEYGWRVLP